MKEKKIEIKSKRIVDLEIGLANDFSYDERYWQNVLIEILAKITKGKEITLVVNKPRKTSVVYSLSENVEYNKSLKILLLKRYLEKDNIISVVEDEDFKLGTLRLLISSNKNIGDTYFDYFNYPNISEEEILIYCNGDGRILTIINCAFNEDELHAIIAK